MVSTIPVPKEDFTEFTEKTQRVAELKFVSFMPVVYQPGSGLSCNLIANPLIFS